MAKGFSVSVSGVGEVLKKFDNLAGNRIATELDAVAETYARKMANESAGMAPVKDGLLRNSIAASPAKSPSEKGVWTWGSNLEYAQRQEYENKTNKAFIRRAIYANREQYVAAVKRKLAEGGK